MKKYAIEEHRLVAPESAEWVPVLESTSLKGLNIIFEDSQTNDKSINVKSLFINKAKQMIQLTEHGDSAVRVVDMDSGEVVWSNVD